MREAFARPRGGLGVDPGGLVQRRRVDTVVVPERRTDAQRFARESGSLRQHDLSIEPEKARRHKRLASCGKVTKH